MIDTREELINALSEAAELEHGLLVQYLFAAFSCKRRIDEGITPVQQAMIVDWERDILQVAHQEMYHLASVCNLLSAIGGAAQLARPNFPQPMGAYYPFDFQLERLNDSSLYRFIVFELPEGEPPPPEPEDLDPEDGEGVMGVLGVAPDPLVYNHVGELYARIKEGFENIPEAKLFIGPRPYQDVEDWGLRLRLHVVRDRATALRAINDIVLEGEGSPNAREGSHYDRFLKLRQALRDERHADPRFRASRPVVLTPQTRRHRDAGSGTLIEHPVTRDVAELFNDVYSTMLLMLTQYYGYGGETVAQRVALRDGCRRLMSAVVRPLAEILTEMPVAAEGALGNAGPGFEIYSGLSLAPDKANRWVFLEERFTREVEEARRLAPQGAGHPPLVRLERLADALQGTAANLAAVFMQQ